MNLNSLTSLSRTELEALHRALPMLSLKDKLELFEDLEVREKRTNLAAAEHSMLGFARAVYPNFKEGPHHRKLAKIFTDVIEGRKKRVIINIAPRFGKSEFASYLFPAYFLGKYPDKKIIMGTHTASLSEDYGRRIRNLVDSEEYHEIFPQTLVASDQKAAGKWSTSAGGQYYAAGVGGALAGRGADLFVIDDPHSEQDIKINSRLAFDTAWTWFQTGPLQRLMPGGGIIVVMCMTGDTWVLLADGSEKALRDMEVGDAVATYEDGGLKTSKVTNFRSNGLDSIYSVRTICGTIVRANERHPFLVDREGVRQWVKLKDLKPGMSLVVSRAAVGPHDHRQQSGDSAIPAKQPARTIRKTPTQHTYLCERTVGGKVWSALKKVVTSLLRVKGCACPTTTKPRGFPADVQQLQNTGEINASSTVTGSTAQGMPHYLRLKKGFVQYVKSLRDKMSGRTGVENSVSTTATTQAKFEGCCATTATSPSGTEKQKPSCVAPLSTYEIILEKIAEVTPDGYEEVFDVEIERTENFIANGVVSHNTRWSLLDLTGRLIDYQIKNPEAEPWEIVELPAILHENTPAEKSLWPEQWPLDLLKTTKASLDPKFWNAQYMQQPTSDAAAVISRKAWRIWPKDDPPKVDIIMQTWDTAFEASTSADYSACTTWGVFYNEEESNKPQLILLDAFKDRMQFPELKAMAFKHYKEWEPDMLMVEKKASGAPLIYELRAMGIPVQEFTPSRGNDKIVRLNAVSDMFASGNVWAPGTRWAREVIEEVASFPNGEHDDYVDCVSMALLRFRQGGLVGSDKDEKDEPQYQRRRMRAYY